jgi:hypothetical protein
MEGSIYPYLGYVVLLVALCCTSSRIYISFKVTVIRVCTSVSQPL